MIGRDFVTYAERIAQDSMEAGLRSAVSRAYYGAFHEALALLYSCGVWLPKTEQVHVKVGYCLRDCGDPDSAIAGRQLDILRSRRKIADYNLDDNRFADPTAVGAETARARQILEIIDQFSSGTATDFRERFALTQSCLG